MVQSETKMKNPGKLILFLLLTAFSLHAGMKASVDTAKVFLGDTVTFSLEIEGKFTDGPALTKLCGENIHASAKMTNIRGINGDFTKTRTFTYTFMPKRDCQIAPVKVKIDGKIEQTKAIHIKVVPPSAQKDPDFVLELSSDTKEVYVGEPFKVTLTFRQRHNNDAVDSKFVPFEAKHFWTKEQTDGRRFEKDGFTVTQHSFIMAAQKAGERHISAAEIKIATRKHTRDTWGMWAQGVKWRSYFSNGLGLKVKPLPAGVSLVGDFKIDVKADKTEIDANEAVNITVSVSGSGNFEDIGSLKPSIAGVSVFDEKAVTKAFIERGNYRGVWRQKMALVSQGDFTVPPITLKYFDPKSGEVKVIETQPVSVHVRNAVPQKADQKIVIERADDTAENASKSPTIITDWKLPLLSGLLGGLILGILLALLPWKKWWSERKDRNSIAISDHKAVLALLLQHLDDEEAVKMVDLLEGNLFEGKNSPIDKKILKALLKRLKG